MFSIVQSTWGANLTSQKITPGDTATAFSANCLQYWEFFLYCDGVDAGSTAVPVGQWIVGQTSSARAIVKSVTLVSGAWGNANARVTLRIRSLSGTFTATENIGVGANLNHLTVRASTTERKCSDEYEYRGAMAKAVLLVGQTNTSLVSTNGATPDQTSLVGVPLVATQSIVIQSIDDIKNFKVIDYTSGSASTVQCSFYF